MRVFYFPMVYNQNKELLSGVKLMNLAEKLLKDFETLPEDKKIEVIDFVNFLKNRNQEKLENMMDLVIAENIVALKELSK